MNLEEIKQAAFEDELEKIAVSEGAWARAAERFGNSRFIISNPDTRMRLRKELENAAISSKGNKPGLFNFGPLAKLQHPSINMLQSKTRIDPKLGLRDTKILKNIFKINK
jgi:hypothetical protein